MGTAQENFEAIYCTPKSEVAKQEAAASAWVADAKAKIEANLEDGDWVFLHLRYHDGRSPSCELLPRYLAELIVNEIPTNPETREVVASARIQCARAWLEGRGYL